VKYLAQLMFADRGYDSVYMVRHHHKFAQIVSHSIKVQRLDSIIVLQSGRARMHRP